MIFGITKSPNIINAQNYVSTMYIDDNQYVYTNFEEPLNDSNDHVNALH